MLMADYLLIVPKLVKRHVLIVVFHVVVMHMVMMHALESMVSFHLVLLLHQAINILYS